LKPHALLSASTSSRWLVCTPSAVLESKLESTASDYADEGTLAHTLAELELKHKLKRICATEYAKQLENVYAHEKFNESMQDYVNDYVAFVLESYAESGRAAQIFLETQMDLTDYVPEGFGTVDVSIINDEVLDIIDLKYGKGVPVSAEENRQLMLYGLGSLREFELLYSVKDVRMTIYQPRIDNYSSFSMSAQDLRKWGEKVLKPTALVAFKGEGEFRPGDHCRFCRAKPTCKANAEYNMEIAKYEFQDPSLLTPQEISDVLSRMDKFINWINCVDEFALKQALEKGVKWPGFKLVEGRSNRKYGDELKVIEVLKKKGFTDDLIFVKKIAGITELSKRIGKPTFDALISPLLIKPPGSPALVPVADKRPEYNSAQEDFKK
jgi:hypothetical protein